MAKKGPGRPTQAKPGPTIPSGGNIPIPNELIENEVIKEVLDGKDFQKFQSLPKGAKEIFINDLKKQLFGIQGKSAHEADLLRYGEEFEAGPGVETSASLNPMDWRDAGGLGPYAYQTLRDWVNGIWEPQDISRELEKQIVEKLMQNGVPGSAINYGMQEDLLEPDETSEEDKKPRTKILEKREMTSARSGRDISQEGGRGVDGLAQYKALADAVGGWIDNSQVLPKREGSIKGFNSQFYTNLALEYLAKGDAESDIWEKDPKEIAQMLDSELASLSNNDILKQIYTSHTNRPAFKRYFEEEGVVELDDEKYSIRDLAERSAAENNTLNPRDNFFAHDQILNQTVNPKTSLKDSFVHQKMFDIMEENAEELGFSSPQAVRKLRESLSDENVGDITGKVIPKWSFGMEVPKDVEDFISNADLYHLGEHMRKLNKTGQEAQERLYTEADAAHLNNEVDIVKRVTSEIDDPEVRKKARDRMLAMENHKKYIQGRSQMLALQEFLDAVKSGDVFQYYVYLGRYNDFIQENFPFLHEIDNKIKNTRIPGTSKTYADAISVWQQERDKVTQKLGLAGDPSAERGLLGVANTPNHAYLYTKDFSPGKYKVKLGEKGVEVNLFPTGESYANFKGFSRDFSRNLTQLDSPGFLVWARDFKKLPDAMAAIEHMADYYSNSPNAIHSVFTQLYANRNNENFENYIASYFRSIGMDEGEISVRIDAFKGIFDKLEEFEAAGVDTEELLSFVLHISKNKNFVKGGKLMTQMPLLNAASSHLSGIQSYLYDFVESKIIKGKLGRFELFEKVWERYKGGYGPYKYAVDIVSWIEGKAPWLTEAWNGFRNKVIAPIVRRLLPKAVASAANIGTLGTAYLAYALGRLGKGIASGFWQSLRNLDTSKLRAEIKDAIDEVIVTPVRIIAKISFYGCFLLFIGVFVFVVYFIGGGLYSNYDRDFASGEGTEFGEEIPLVDNPNEEVGGQCFAAAEGNTPSSDFSNKISAPLQYSSNSSCPGWRSFRGNDDFHKGMDYPAGAGTNVSFTYNGEGTVVKAGSNNYGYGNLVVVRVDEADGPYYLYYAHLQNGSINVSQGDTVGSGDLLGGVNSTGRSSGNHLHFEVKKGGRRVEDSVNPCSVIDCPSNCSTEDFEGPVCPTQ